MLNFLNSLTATRIEAVASWRSCFRQLCEAYRWAGLINAYRGKQQGWNMTVLQPNKTKKEVKPREVILHSCSNCLASTVRQPSAFRVQRLGGEYMAPQSQYYSTILHIRGRQKKDGDFDDCPNVGLLWRLCSEVSSGECPMLFLRRRPAGPYDTQSQMPQQFEQ